MFCPKCGGLNDSANSRWCLACLKDLYHRNRERYLAARRAKRRAARRAVSTTPLELHETLKSNHYLGARSGPTYADRYGIMVFGNPVSAYLPQKSWVELARWFVEGDEENSGSRMWRAARKWLLERFPKVTTVVSYSDPGVGHTGALYRACNWLWAPTADLLTGKKHRPWSPKDVSQGTAKDRWVFALRPDPNRVRILQVKPARLAEKFSWAVYVEGKGGDYKRYVQEREKGNVPDLRPVERLEEGAALQGLQTSQVQDKS